MRILSLKDKLYFHLMEGLFFVLPKKFLKIYVYLSLSIFIQKLKFNDFSIERLNKDKFTELLSISLNKDVLILPGYTYNFLLKDVDILDQIVKDDNGTFTVKEIVNNYGNYSLYTSRVIEVIYNKLPSIIKLKLTNFNKANEGPIKKELEAVLRFSF